MKISLTEDELSFLMSALRAQMNPTRGLDPLQMSAAQLEDVDTCMTIGSKAVDFDNQKLPLTEDEVTFLIVLFSGMLGRFAYDAKYSEHRILEGSIDLLNDGFCRRLISKLSERIDP